MSGKQKPDTLLYCTICGKSFWGQLPRKYCSKECQSKANSIKRAAKRYSSRYDYALSSLRQRNDNTGGCRGCAHFDSTCCQYLGDNGRVRPCAVYPGGGCEMYTPKVRKSYEAGMDKWDWDDAKARELLDSGMSVYEVAEELGASPNSIKAMLRHGDHESHTETYDREDSKSVPTEQKRRGTTRKTFDEEQFKALYAQGLNDEQAAKVMGWAYKTVAARRIKLGLPPNGARKPFDETLYRKLHAQGMLDAEAAKVMGLTQSAVQKHRVKMGLPANGGRCN